MRCALLLACLAAAPGRAETPPTVILISLDGTRPADLEGADLPTFAALRRRGAWASRMLPVFPSNTFPNHVTLVTGVSPDVHGIVNNAFVDPERGEFDKDADPTWLLAEPLWSIAAQHGVVSASYHWVGSEGPWTQRPRPALLDALRREASPRRRRSSRSSRGSPGPSRDRGSSPSGFAAPTPPPTAPGWRRPPVRRALRAQDAALGAPGRRPRRERRLRAHDAADRLRPRHGAGVPARRSRRRLCARPA